CLATVFMPICQPFYGFCVRWLACWLISFLVENRYCKVGCFSGVSFYSVHGWLTYGKTDLNLLILKRKQRFKQL
ncbi:MAG: hypothetical protein II052_01165, partial [Prevotella sp.]|nr:hypothetical protein [Prevotella sp.]